MTENKIGLKEHFAPSQDFENNQNFKQKEENISVKERNFIDTHPIFQNKYVNRKFIFRHYEKCYFFVKEMLESESITVREHRILKDLLKIKIMNETRGKHILPFITGCLSLRVFFKTKSYLFKIAIALGYYLFVFDFSYSLGIHLFNIMKFPSLFGTLMKLNDGESIQSMQTKLFIKKCLLDQFREDNKLKEKPSWKSSFLMNEVFWKNVYKAKKSLYIKTA